MVHVLSPPTSLAASKCFELVEKMPLHMLCVECECQVSHRARLKTGTTQMMEFFGFSITPSRKGHPQQQGHTLNKASNCAPDIP